MGKQVTVGAFVTDLVLSQNYFETIFIRIPKKITDEIVECLKGQGLPHAAIGNGGQGGPDRRGGDDGRARPASVKVWGLSSLPCWQTLLLMKSVFWWVLLLLAISHAFRCCKVGCPFLLMQEELLIVGLDAICEK
jgi:hypothetical protein